MFVERPLGQDVVIGKQSCAGLHQNAKKDK
jgi:hypothetical protein